MLTVDRILRGIKRRITLPANQSLLTDTDMLEMCDDVIKIEILPHIIALRQDFLVRKIRVQTIANQAVYDIPYRAMGMTLRDLKLSDVQGNSVRDLVIIQLENEHEFRNGGGIPSGFYFYNDKIVLIDTPLDNLRYVEFWIEMAVSYLVLEQDCAVVQSISNDNVTVASVPSTITIGSKIDFVKAKQGSSVITFDKVVSGISGTTISFAAGGVPNTIDVDNYGTLSIGDYICPAEKTPVLPLPDICASFLETTAAKRILFAIGDQESSKAMDKEVDRELDLMLKMLAPRIRGENIKIVQTQAGLLNRPRGFRMRRGLY